MSYTGSAPFYGAKGEHKMAQRVILLALGLWFAVIVLPPLFGLTVYEDGSFQGCVPLMGCVR